MKVVLGKSAYKKLQELNKEDQKTILTNLEHIQNSERPTSHTYETISPDLGELIIYINEYVLPVKVTKRKMKILNFISL